MAKYRVTQVSLTKLEKMPPTFGSILLKVLGTLFALWVIGMVVAHHN